MTIEEHISGELHVMAGDVSQALALAEEKYRRGEFVIPPSTPTMHLIMAQNDKADEVTEWTEF